MGVHTAARSELALVLVRIKHVASLIVAANHSTTVALRFLRVGSRFSAKPVGVGAASLTFFRALTANLGCSSVGFLGNCVIREFLIIDNRLEHFADV